MEWTGRPQLEWHPQGSCSQQYSQFRGLGGNFTSISSESADIIEPAKEPTGPRFMDFMSDYYKTIARSYGLMELEQPQFNHNDHIMTQPAMCVLYSSAEVIFFWKSVQAGPKIRPIPDTFLRGLNKAVLQHDPSLTAEGLVPFLPEPEDGQGQTEFVQALLLSFHREGIH
jgi:hypothetical protein